MANEAVILDLYGQPKGEPLRYTCGDTQAIEKGSLLWMQDLFTVSGAATAAISLGAAGVAAEEKVAGDGATTIGVWTKGHFDLTLAANTTVVPGDYLEISGQNLVGLTNTARVITGHVIAKAEEDGTSSAVTRCKLIV